MAPEQICRELTKAGFHVRSEDGRLLVSPMSLLPEEARQLLRDHKAELIEFLQCETLDKLLTAATRACDRHRDSDAARQDMWVDCFGTPAHLRLDLLHHFERTYGACA